MHDDATDPAIPVGLPPGVLLCTCQVLDRSTRGRAVLTAHDAMVGTE